MAITVEQYNRSMTRHKNQLQKRLSEERTITHVYELHVPGMVETITRECSENSLEHFLSRACLREVKGRRVKRDGVIHVYTKDLLCVYK